VLITITCDIYKTSDKSVGGFVKKRGR